MDNNSTGCRILIPATSVAWLLSAGGVFGFGWVGGADSTSRLGHGWGADGPPETNQGC